MGQKCNTIYSKQQIRAFHDSLHVLNGKWKLSILQSIALGNSRFRQIKEDIVGITPRALSKELRDLEENGIIAKHAHTEDYPEWQEYRFTEYSKQLAPLIDLLMVWGASHREMVFVSLSKCENSIVENPTS